MNDNSGAGRLARNLRRLRLARGIQTQHALAELSGVEQHDLSRIESGATANPAREKLELVAAVLGVTVDDLYSDPDAPPPLALGLQEFFDSDVGRGAMITDEERAELARSRWAPGPAKPEAWFLVLQAIRMTRAAQSG